MLKPLKMKLTKKPQDLLALELILLDAKSRLQKLLLLLEVHILEARSHARARVAARIHDVPPVMVLRLVEQRLDAGLCEAPGSRVERLFLRPDNVLRVGVRVEVFLDELPGERVQFFDARNGRVGQAVLGAVLVQCCVDLACAEYYALDVLWGADLEVVDAFVRGVRDYPPELGVAGEFVQIRASERVAEERL